MTATGDADPQAQQSARDLVSQLLEFTGSDVNEENEAQAMILLQKHNGNLEAALDAYLNNGWTGPAQESSSSAVVPYLESAFKRPVPPVPSTLPTTSPFPTVSQDPTKPPPYVSFDADGPGSRPDFEPIATRKGVRGRARRQTGPGPQPENTVDLTGSDSDNDLDDDLKRAMAASLMENHRSHESSARQTPGISAEDADLQRALQMSMSSLSGDDQDDLMRNGPSIEPGPHVPWVSEMPPMSLHSSHQPAHGNDGTIDPNFTSWQQPMQTTRSGWTPSHSPPLGPQPLASLSSRSLRPEVLVTRRRVEDESMDAEAEGAGPSAAALPTVNSSSPPMGLVAPTTILQGFASLLQALYATPPAREAILSYRPPDPRAEDFSGFWQGDSPRAKEPPAHSAERASEAPTEQPAPAPDSVPNEQETPKANAADDMDTTDPEESIGVAVSSGSTDTDMSDSPQVSPALRVGGDGVHSQASEAVQLVQRAQSLFAYMQRSNRAWVQISDVSAALQSQAQRILTYTQDPVAVATDLYACIAGAYLSSARANAPHSHRRANSGPGADNTSADDHTALIDAGANQLDFVFQSSGGLSERLEPHDEPPNTKEIANTMLLCPDSLHTTVELAFRRAIANVNFLVCDAAQVMVFIFNHSARAETFEYEETLYIDQLLWSKRRGARLATVDKEELERLIREEKAARGDAFQLTAYNGKHPAQLMQASIDFFEGMAKHNDRPDEAVSAANAAAKLKVILKQLKDARSELLAHADSAKETQMDLQKQIVDEHKEAGQRAENREVAYELRGLVFPAEAGSAYAVVKNDDGEWWRVAPCPDIAGRKAGSVEKLSQEEIANFPKMAASFAVYGLKSAFPQRSEPLWPTEKVKIAGEADNASIPPNVSTLEQLD